MKIPGLCTQTTTMICLVQTTWRSSLIGQHINKPWCHSCAITVILFLFVCATYLIKTCISSGILAYRRLLCMLKREIREWDRGYCSIGRSQGHPERAETRILFQAKLYLHHHQMGFTMVQWFTLLGVTKLATDLISLQCSVTRYSICIVSFPGCLGYMNELQSLWL